MNELRFSDALSILLRRRKIFLGITLGVFVMALFFAFNWTNYRATATVEVAQPVVSSEITSSMGTNPIEAMETLADLHISRLQQKVFSTGSLIEIITKFDLYTEARKYTPVALIAERMRKKIKLELVSSSMANPASAQKASANQLSAIAFKLSYDYSDPLIAQQVTNEIVSRFLDEDLKERRNQSKGTSEFLALQIQNLETALAEQEKKIADFRATNGDTRPEALIFNQQAAVSTTMSLQSIESQMTANLGTQGALRAQLAQTDPYSRIIENGQVLTTPTLQLRALKSEYTTLRAKYGPQHPDVQKVKRQMEAMEAQNGPANNVAPLKAKISDITARLQTAQKTYGDKNPDVISLKNQLKNFEDQLMAELQTGPASPSSVLADADNPAYLQIVAQIQAAEEQHKALSAQKATLMKQQAKYARAVAENPAVEQQLASLSRDYENALIRYRELKAKKMSADMSETIEQDRSGQRLVVIEPPDLPLRTHPTRLVFVLSGFVLAILSGLTSVIALQTISQGVVGQHHLESLVGVAPLVVVPHLKTTEEKNQMNRKKIRFLGFSIILAILFLIAFSFIVMPLDVLWVMIVQRIGLY